MTDLFAWDNGVADGTVVQVNVAKTLLTVHLQILVAQVNAAKDAGAWSGYEEETFRLIFDNWHKAADGVFQVLDGISKLVDGSNDAVQKYRDEIMKALG